MSKREGILRWAVVLCIVFIGGLFSLHLSINDDALDLLPDGAVRGDLQLLQEIGLVDRLFITLRADEQHYETPSDARPFLQESARQLGEALSANSMFENVLSRLPTGFERDFISRLLPVLPVLLEDEDLDSIKTLTSEGEVRRQLYENYLLLNSPAGIAVKKQIGQDPLGFLGLLFDKLTYLQAEFSVVPDHGFLQSRDGMSILVLAKSRSPLTDSGNSGTLQAELEKIYGDVLQPGIVAEIIGTLPHTLANSNAIKRDLRILLPVASVLLILLLAVTLRDIRAIVVFGVPFLGALPAIAVTAALYGEISGLALGFGIVILGISVDFSVHLFVALTREDGSRSAIMNDVRRPIIFATLTTASVLIVLFFSDVSSHRQMATLALAGVLFGVVFAWLLIPTVISGKNARGGQKKKLPVSMTVALSHPIGRTAVWGGWFILLVLGVWSWPQLRYNGDLRVLDAPDEDVVTMERHFSEAWGDKGEQAFVVTTGEDLDGALSEAGDLFMFLRDRGATQVQSPVPLLPDKQTQEKRIQAWEEQWEKVRPQFDTIFQEVAEGQGFSPRAFRPFFSWLDQEPLSVAPGYFQGTMFDPMLQSMIHHVSRLEGGTLQDRYLVVTTVGIDDSLLPVLLGYADKHPSVSVLANRKWRAEVESLLKKDILLLSCLAGALVILLVALQFRNPASVGAVLAPVVSALAAMSLFCKLTGSELNMMHLIMGIMVIGLSVDYGIFIVCSRFGQVSASASFAVSVCAASSLIGFGVLSFASHPALYSLGLTVLVGIGTAWPVALLVSPLIVGERPGGA
ncbi:MMPL family transporter [Desulfopila sp. IMCC35008]|uniref:MMPL family transporter n=1 Tax=Desulfopila sp. IMCC35008 TaxID=2653858 RepID=UPI0013D7317C|nr:MMPL family transporter [Desulfopila sp. IMCC35008]